MLTPDPAARPEPPTGTVTFVFSDIEGSTRLLRALGDDYPRVLAEHRELLQVAAHGHGGHVMGSEGDALFVAFPDAPSALAYAIAGQRAMAAHEWPPGHPVRVRIGIHTGEALRVGDDYVGLTLHEAARITSAANGGQMLLSGATRSLVATQLPEGVHLIDLGLHRLKDLAEPERLFQVDDPETPGPFPPPRSLDARPNNLPVQVTSFIGRAELAEARRLLAGAHLLTLTGPGGTGKTRLALQLAAELSDDFPDGVFFVPLDAVTDPELVPSAIVSALGLEAGKVPSIERLLAWGREMRVLLVLDNFEQVVDAVSSVSRLLRELPQIRIVVTSRTPLRVYGEQELPVPPLGVPQPDGLTAEAAARSEAVRLFVERAMSAQPSFRLSEENASLVVDIVRRLDGLPLAIELAAARVRLLSVPVLRERLDRRLSLLVGGPRDRPSRQQTLRGAIDWSFDLLDEGERRLFERFGVFAGGAWLLTAETVCGPAAELGGDAFDGLTSLADKSLLRTMPDGFDEPRFALLATIREYALGAACRDRRDRRAPAQACGSLHGTGGVGRAAPDRTGGQAVARPPGDRHRQLPRGAGLDARDGRRGVRAAPRCRAVALLADPRPPGGGGEPPRPDPGAADARPAAARAPGPCGGRRRLDCVLAQRRLGGEPALRCRAGPRARCG